MSKLVILSFCGGLGYFAIQYLGGWMIYIPIAQQLLVAILSLTLCIIADKLLRVKIDIMVLLIAPTVSFLMLVIGNKARLDIIYGISFLNLLAYMFVIIIYKKLIRDAPIYRL